MQEILWTLFWSGSPIYVLGIVGQGLWLHQRASDFNALAIFASVTFSTLLTLLAGLVIWGQFFAGVQIMLWQVINLPALIASVCVYPIVTSLIIFGFSSR